jgi:putative endopeptidase
MAGTQARWAERVQAWRASGKTAEEFATGLNFEASTLRYWASRLKSDAVAKDAIANFAAIGTVLAHEITHAFDSSGRRFDGSGNERNWWTDAAALAYVERSRCLDAQYEGFTLPDVPDPTTGETPAHVDGERTLDENIADNGGLKVAYRAAKVAGSSAPVALGFTPPQQFFVGYAQLRCGKQSPAIQSMSLYDSHSPPKARTNLPLANFSAFAEAFQCPSGSPLAPAARCSVW